jgi:iron(III) transport system permease protein
MSTTSSTARPFELQRWRLPVEAGLWTWTALVLALPLIALVLSSFVPAVGVPLSVRTATLANYEFIMFGHDAARRALFNSFGMSATAAAAIVAIATPLAYFVVWRRSRLLHFVNFVIEVPYALPGVVLAIAAILLFLKPVPVIGLSIYNTVWIILFCYLARFLVLGLRPVMSGYHQLDRTLEEAAQIAGARLPRRLITIILPLVAPAAAAGALLIFLTAFNELTVSALLWSSGSETLGVVFFSFQQGGDSNFAAALGVSAEKHPITHENVYTMTRTSRPVVSPDRRWILYSVSEPNYDPAKANPFSDLPDALTEFPSFPDLAGVSVQE